MQYGNYLTLKLYIEILREIQKNFTLNGFKNLKKSIFKAKVIHEKANKIKVEYDLDGVGPNM